MKSWKRSEPFLDKNGGCRRCTNPGRLKKIRDAVSRTVQKFRSLWEKRKEEHQRHEDDAHHNDHK